VGWSRQPQLECNLENARFYRLRPLQRFRMKRWDYYAVLPRSVLLGYYRRSGVTLAIFCLRPRLCDRRAARRRPGDSFGRGIDLPRNSIAGDAHFSDAHASLDFQITPLGARSKFLAQLSQWAWYQADILLYCQPGKNR